MKNKEISILGGTGFIGKNLVNFFLKKGFKVYSTYHKSKPFKRKNLNWFKIDLRKPNGLKKLFKNKKIVIQAAATTSGSKTIINHPYVHVTDNAVMNSYILRSIFENNVSHFIFLSCSVMYPPKKYKQSEKEGNIPNKILDKYFGVGNTKLYIENMCKFFSKISNTKFTVIRHSNIYGQFDKYDLENSHFFGASITKVLQANKFIEVWGDGEEKRDLLHVSDLMNFIQLILHKQKSNFEIYNVAYSKTYKIREIIKKIIFYSKKKLKINYNASKPSIKISTSLNISKAKKIGWQPKISLDRGIKITLKERKNELKK
jgi:GDP-L-fucose synthase